MSKSFYPQKKIGDLQFYQVPYLEILLGLMPQSAIGDVAMVFRKLVHDEESAATVLQLLIDQGRKACLQCYIIVEHPELSLPEVHRLTNAILSLDFQNEVYCSPKVISCYNKTVLLSLFQI